MREAINETISLIKPVTREIKKFLIEVRIFKKNATIEVRIAKIPILIETMTFLTADIKPRKNVLMA